MHVGSEKLGMREVRETFVQDSCKKNYAVCVLREISKEAYGAFSQRHGEGDNFSAAMHFSQKLTFLSLNATIQVNFWRKLPQLCVVTIFNKTF